MTPPLCRSAHLRRPGQLVARSKFQSRVEATDTGGVTSLTPIYSEHDEDLSLRDRIETFVVGLAEHVDELQDAEMTGDFAAIHRAARISGLFRHLLKARAADP